MVAMLTMLTDRRMKPEFKEYLHNTAGALQRASAAQHDADRNEIRRAVGKADCTDLPIPEDDCSACKGTGMRGPDCPCGACEGTGIATSDKD